MFQAFFSCFAFLTEPRHCHHDNHKHDHLSRSNTLSTGKMKPRSLFPLCLLLPAVCGGDGSSAATIVRRRREAQQTQNENDLRRQREVSLSDHSSDIKRFGPGRSLCLSLMERYYPFFPFHVLVVCLHLSARRCYFSLHNVATLGWGPLGAKASTCIRIIDAAPDDKRGFHSLINQTVFCLAFIYNALDQPNPT